MKKNYEDIYHHFNNERNCPQNWKSKSCQKLNSVLRNFSNLCSNPLFYSYPSSLKSFLLLICEQKKTLVNGLNPGVSVVLRDRPGEGSLQKDHCWWLMFQLPEWQSSSELSGSSVKTSFTNNSFSEDYSHLDDHTRQTSERTSQHALHTLFHPTSLASEPFDLIYQHHILPGKQIHEQYNLGQELIVSTPTRCCLIAMFSIFTNCVNDTLLYHELIS